MARKPQGTAHLHVSNWDYKHVPLGLTWFSNMGLGGPHSGLGACTRNTLTTTISSAIVDHDAQGQDRQTDRQTDNRQHFFFWDMSIGYHILGILGRKGENKQATKPLSLLSRQPSRDPLKLQAQRHTVSHRLKRRAPTGKATNDRVTKAWKEATQGTSEQ